jgi:tRNA G46 methylase TrmB
MHGNSRRPESGQSGPHPALERKVWRHLQYPWRAPVADHTRRAFEEARRWRYRRGTARPLILDSGCGTGRSSVHLARTWPEALVIGVDQSRARLERASARFSHPDNLLLLQAESADFLRLARSEGWRPARQYLLYPNPWPRPAHLGRRWHGHPVFPTLLALGGALELRSNWRLYLEEFRLALNLADVSVRGPELLASGSPWTDFEAKYAASDHALFRLRAELRGDQAPFR